MSSIGGRLLEERERLGLSQPKLAELCGVTMRSQRNYEKDERQPDALYLAALATAGVDVLYVITGQHGGVLLNPQETALLDNFRNSSLEARDHIKATSDAFSKLRGNKRSA